jgi:hypothetical protein
MTEGRDIVCHLGDPPMLNGNPATPNTFPSSKFHNRGKFFRCAELAVAAVSLPLTLSGTLSRSVARLRIQSSSSLPVVAWGQLCTAIYRGAPKPRAKPSDHLIGPTNRCSVRVWRMSLGSFGPQKQPLTLLRSSDVVSALLNFGSPANENGRAMRSPPSFPKSCAAIPCATSRSFPNGNSRPF